MITVYTGNGCAYCPMVKKYLTMKGLEFEEINVDESPNHSRQTLVGLTGMTLVPVTVTPKGISAGWNIQQLSSLVTT